MPVTTFAAPILPENTEAWKQAAQEIAGSRKPEYEESRRRLGVTREIASLQSTPQGACVVVGLEADRPDEIISGILAPDTPFDRWFAETVLKGVHGIGGAQEPPPPNQVFLD